MSTGAVLLRLLFGLACAWPLLCLPLPRSRRQGLLRGLLALALALGASAVPAERVFFERVDGRLLSGVVCGA